MFTRQEINALIQEARREPEGGIGYSAGVICQHLAKFDTSKRQSSKDKHWTQVVQEAYRLKKRLAL
jgi:hypothetical protein